MNKGIIKNVWSLLRNDFLGTLGTWQDKRIIWLLGAFTALGAEIFSVYVFQNRLGVEACEMCVYIRFAMLILFLGGFIGAIAPKNVFCKIIGYSITLWATLRGLIWSINLEMINIEAANNSNFISSCSILDLNFPFGLPLAQWFPTHFFPIGLCGEDKWRFLGMNMAEISLIMFAGFAILLLLMLAGWIKNQLRLPKE